MVWKGVSFQNPTDETIVFGKGNQTTSVSLKAFLNQDPLVEIREEEFELEYKLREDKSLKMRLRGEEEFLGLEHHLNF